MSIFDFPSSGRLMLAYYRMILTKCHILSCSSSISSTLNDTLYPCSLSHNSILSDSEHKNVNTSILSMTSTGQATSSTSNVQIIIDAALADYAKITGTDLSKAPFAVALEQSNSPEEVLQLLQEREKDFKEYRNGNRRLIESVSLVVKLIQPLSTIIRKEVSKVSRTCHPMTLLTVASSDPLPTNERSVCRHRCSPCCMSLESDFNQFAVVNEYVRLPVGSRQATMLFSSCSSAWGSS